MTDPPRLDRPADDLLIGAPAIAAFVGVSAKAVYHLARTKKLPIGKLGKNLIASKRKLERALASLTSGVQSLSGSCALDFTNGSPPLFYWWASDNSFLDENDALELAKKNGPFSTAEEAEAAAWRRIAN